MSEESAERSSVDLKQADQQIESSINASPHFERLMQTFCREIGPRPAGSPAMRRGADFLAQQWEQLGASNVHTEEVPIRAWEDGGTELQIISSLKKDYPAVQCVNSASTTVQGPLVDAGSLSPADLGRLGHSLRGSVALLDGVLGIHGGRYSPLQKFISQAEGARTSAVIVIHPDRSKPGVDFLHHSGIPVLEVSTQAGQELLELCKAGEVKVAIKTTGKSRPAKCVNLIGQMGSTPEPKEIIASCAHLDGYHVAPAAMDDLSGIVTLSEIARVLAPYQQRFVRTWRMFAWTAEEHMFVGSRHYVREHADELDRFRFILSLDCLFDSTAEGVAVMWDPQMRDYIAQSLAQQHPEVDVRNYFCMSSDYLPFMLEGIAAARPADFKNQPTLNTNHTTEDTEERVPISWLKANAIVYARLLLRLLTDSNDLPTKRKSPEQVDDLIKQDDAEEALRWLLLTC